MNLKQQVIQDLDKMMRDLGVEPSEALGAMLLMTFAYFILLNTPANPSWLLIVLGWYGMISTGLATVLMAVLASRRARQQNQGK